MVRYGACLIGLAHRHLYTTGAHVLDESLELPDRPEGYDALCRMVMAGDLADAARVADAVEAFWEGIERWAAARGLAIERELDELLEYNQDDSQVKPVWI